MAVQVFEVIRIAVKKYAGNSGFEVIGIGIGSRLKGVMQVLKNSGSGVEKFNNNSLM